MTHGPGVTSATAAGPIPHCPVRAKRLVAVGNEKIGPTAQVSFSGARLVKNASSCVSAVPPLRKPFPKGMLTKGTIVRDTRSQRSPIGNGSTGCTLSTISAFSPSPPAVK